MVDSHVRPERSWVVGYCAPGFLFYRSMNRVLFVCLLIVACVAGPRNEAVAHPASSMLGEPQGGLRGEAVDLDDPWDSVRLLASFGEPSAARLVGRRRPDAQPDELRIEMFEARLLTQMGLFQQADSLLALRFTVSDARERYLHYLWRARLNAAGGRFDRALDFVGRLAALQDTVFDSYRDLVAVETLLRIDSPRAASELARERLRLGVPPSLGVEFEKLLLEAYMRDGRVVEAMEFLNSLERAARRRPALAPVMAREVELRFLLGDTLGAVGAALDLVKTNETATSVAAVDTVLDRIPVESLQSEALLEFARLFVRRGRTSDADRMVAVLSTRVLDESAGER